MTINSQSVSEQVIYAQANAKAIVDLALKNPEALYKLPDAEFWALLSAAGQTGDPISRQLLCTARDQVRDVQPELVEAHQAVVAALASPSQILAMNPKQWTALLKAADLIPRGFKGRYHNFRSDLIMAKTDALISARIDAIPESSIKHLGIHGRVSLELVRKIDAVIGTNWLTVPRLSVARNRKEMTYNNGVPDAELNPSDAGWGPFHGIPLEFSYGTTSIICELKSAALLKLFDLTAFDVNISPELESYFRSLAPFPWE
jgi:hypothetical protein